MMRRSEHEIKSVFSKFLGKRARELAAAGKIKIIEHRDFPEGAPIHEDGSTKYDPRKHLVLFAVHLTTRQAVAAWTAVEREFDQLRGEHVRNR